MKDENVPGPSFSGDAFPKSEDIMDEDDDDDDDDMEEVS